LISPEKICLDLGQRGEAEEKVGEEEIRPWIVEAENAGILEPGEKEMIAGVMIGRHCSRFPYRLHGNTKPSPGFCSSNLESPTVGEHIDANGWRFEIVDSTDAGSTRCWQRRFRGGDKINPITT
jgi:CBS domain containing-hemolysin-like protein